MLSDSHTFAPILLLRLKTLEVSLHALEIEMQCKVLAKVMSALFKTDRKENGFVLLVMASPSCIPPPLGAELLC